MKPFAAAIAVAALIAAGSASGATAAAPCWRAVFDDWYEGRVDRTYEITCYRDALRHLPDDVRAYSSAEEDITRAMLEAIRMRSDAHDRPAASGVLGAQATRGTDQERRVLQERSSGLASSGEATSPPLPLLLAAGFASLLLAIGIGGKLRGWRRARLSVRQAR